MDVAAMYDHQNRSAPIHHQGQQHQQHMNHTSYHQTSSGGVSSVVNVVSEIHKRDKELIYG